MKISFKAKIPISQCQVYDRQDKKFVPAALYEFDCRDYSDIQHFRFNFKKWTYMESFISAMRSKYRNIRNGFPEISTRDRFYSLELPNNNIVGFCETMDNRTSKNVYYLETDRERRYKYAGQGILASVAKQMLKTNDNPEMTIACPAASARNFYIDKCGFQPQNNPALSLEKDDMSDFVKTFEDRTQKPIIDFIS